MTIWYPKILEAQWNPSAFPNSNLNTGTLRFYLLTSSYVYNAAHEFAIANAHV